jgi:hypothetical protein
MLAQIPFLTTDMFVLVSNLLSDVCDMDDERGATELFDLDIVLPSTWISLLRHRVTMLSIKTRLSLDPSVLHCPRLDFA